MSQRTFVGCRDDITTTEKYCAIIGGKDFKMNSEESVWLYSPDSPLQFYTLVGDEKSNRTIGDRELQVSQGDPGISNESLKQPTSSEMSPDVFQHVQVPSVKSSEKPKSSLTMLLADNQGPPKRRLDHPSSSSRLCPFSPRAADPRQDLTSSGKAYPGAADPSQAQATEGKSAVLRRRSSLSSRDLISVVAAMGEISMPPSQCGQTSQYPPLGFAAENHGAGEGDEGVSESDGESGRVCPFRVHPAERDGSIMEELPPFAESVDLTTTGVRDFIIMNDRRGAARNEDSRRTHIRLSNSNDNLIATVIKNGDTYLHDFGEVFDGEEDWQHGSEYFHHEDEGEDDSAAEAEEDRERVEALRRMHYDRRNNDNGQGQGQGQGNGQGQRRRSDLYRGPDMILPPEVMCAMEGGGGGRGSGGGSGGGGDRDQFSIDEFPYANPSEAEEISNSRRYRSDSSSRSRSRSPGSSFARSLSFNSLHTGIAIAHRGTGEWQVTQDRPPVYAGASSGAEAGRMRSASTPPLFGSIRGAEVEIEGEAEGGLIGFRGLDSLLENKIHQIVHRPAHKTTTSTSASLAVPVEGAPRGKQVKFDDKNDRGRFGFDGLHTVTDRLGAASTGYQRANHTTQDDFQIEGGVEDNCYFQPAHTDYNLNGDRDNSDGFGLWSPRGPTPGRPGPVLVPALPDLNLTISVGDYIAQKSAGLKNSARALALTDAAPVPLPVHFAVPNHPAPYPYPHYMDNSQAQAQALAQAPLPVGPMAGFAPLTGAPSAHGRYAPYPLPVPPIAITTSSYTSTTTISTSTSSTTTTSSFNKVVCDSRKETISTVDSSESEDSSDDEDAARRSHVTPWKARNLRTRLSGILKFNFDRSGGDGPAISSGMLRRKSQSQSQAVSNQTGSNYVTGYGTGSGTGSGNTGYESPLFPDSHGHYPVPVPVPVPVPIITHTNGNGACAPPPISGNGTLLRGVLKGSNHSSRSSSAHASNHSSPQARAPHHARHPTPTYGIDANMGYPRRHSPLSRAHPDRARDAYSSNSHSNSPHRVRSQPHSQTHSPLTLSTAAPATTANRQKTLAFAVPHEQHQHQHRQVGYGNSNGGVGLSGHGNGNGNGYSSNSSPPPTKIGSPSAKKPASSPSQSQWAGALVAISEMLGFATTSTTTSPPKSASPSASASSTTFAPLAMPPKSLRRSAI